MDEWKKLYQALLEASLDVYAPGAHCGVCKKPYCVVRQISSSLAGSGMGWVRYRITMMVPVSCPAALGELYKDVRKALQPLVERRAIELAAPMGAVTVDEEFSALAAYCDYVAWFAEY